MFLLLYSSYCCDIEASLVRTVKCCIASHLTEVLKQEATPSWRKQSI